MAGIIKSGEYHDGPRTTNSSAFNLADMSQQAETYLQSVQRRAAQIIAQAKEQAAAIEAKACERGRQAALREAEQLTGVKLDRQLQTFLPAMAKAVEAIQQSRQAWLKHWEERTVSLATSIAQRVVRGELTRKPEIALTWIREALELATGQGRLSVRLNPQDFASLGARAEAIVAQLAPLGNSQVEPDPDVEPGGCRILTEFGSVDQQITSQLKRIEQELTG